jgi:hypothetical protein
MNRGINTRTGRLALVAVLVVALAAASAAPKESKKSGLFAPLEAGQRVGLREKDCGWEIDIVPGVEGGHKVVEVGSDCVVLEDAAGVTETRIPICAVKAVKITRLPGDK